MKLNAVISHIAKQMKGDISWFDMLSNWNDRTDKQQKNGLLLLDV